MYAVHPSDILQLHVVQDLVRKVAVCDYNNSD